MAEDRQYSSKNYLYRSRGLAARWEVDRVPEYYYLNNLNCQERDEESLSSRYGTTIVNRDPDGTFPAGHNWYFSSPVTSLAKLNYQTAAYRYAGLADGTLWQRAGNSQGPYTQIYSGLSGQPFQSVVASCFETAQPYLFIYDQAASIKIASGSSTPQLTGIDPPPYTANTQPFSPLLTLVDNFATGNSYVASGFSGSWAHASVTTITAPVSNLITDFYQFYTGTQYATTTPTPGSITESLSSPGVASNNTSFNFPSVGLSATTGITLIVAVAGSGINFSGTAQGEVVISFSYTIFPASGSPNTFTIHTYRFSSTQIFGPAQTFIVTLNGMTNLSQLVVTATATVSFVSGGGTISGTARVNSAIALVPIPGIFGSVCDGILSVLNSNSTINIPIGVITGTTNSILLAVTTLQPHGRSIGDQIGIYGCSNPALDGYYPVVSIQSVTQFSVNLLATSLYEGLAVSATGGVVTGGAAAPSTAVLVDEYSSPYPTQFSAWGFYQQVPAATTSFPVGCWTGTVATNSTATVAVTANFDLSYERQVNDFDLIVLTLKVGSPANIASIKLQFDVNGSGYTSSYYTATLSPAFYQGSIANQISAYQATQNQILADALGLISGQTVASTTAQLQPSNFSTGSGSWAAVLVPRGNFLPVGTAGQSGLDWSNITGWQVIIQTTSTVITGDGSSTISLNGLYLQWGYGPSSFAGVGYDWRYTYYNDATGTESSPSPIQNFNLQYGYLSSLSAPFYLRQASLVSGQYSTDGQTTHVRLYRRGGLYPDNWYQSQQFPNVAAGGAFTAKDVTPDASLSQAKTLALDNDPPVTSTLPVPINTTLTINTVAPGESIYSTYTQQQVVVADNTANFVPNQVVVVGNAYNLEEVLVVVGGVGRFTAFFRLQHNAGEPVSATSIPRQKCSLVALSNQGGVQQKWLAGDKANPHYLYRSKPGYPESFSPADYFPVSSPDDPVMAVVNWRGTIVVGTLKTWYIVVGGAKPYPQPTGSQHGIVASQGWVEGEGTIFYRAADGLRVFVGADGEYLTLPVEWIYRNNQLTPVPLADLTEASQDILAYFQNQVVASYVSQSGGGQRYRLIFDTNYKRFRVDDVPATAMLWEKDTNQLLVGRQISATSYAIVMDQQYTKDYDDGGWNGTGTALIQTPITITTETPYRDLGAPHFPKQWNMMEGDYNTQGQPLQTTLLFKGEQDFSLALPAVNTGGVREKIQFQITQPPSASNVVAGGVEAYSMAIQHTMAVTVAPTLYQENLYAEGLADQRTSYDTYVQKFGTDLLKLVKDGYFDYTATAQLVVSLYADGGSIPYYVDAVTLIPQANRSTVRIIFPARKCRLWRMTVVSTAPFKLWAPVNCEIKPLQEGSGYAQYEFPVYMSGQEGVQSQG